MKIFLRQFTVLFALLSIPFLMWGQCGTCPGNVNNCLSPFCCIATPTNTLDNCIANGATTVVVNYNASISSGTDASGVHFCLRNGVSINFAGDVLVDNATCFTPGNNNGNIIFIGGTTLSFQGPVAIGELNNEIAMIPSGTNATISSIMAALPVELISFTGKASQSGAQLEWVTATETDNDYFLLEYSTDAKTFEYLANIPAQGDGSQQQQYQYLDKNAKAGINYYRLWQYDVDGTKANLGLVEVNNNQVTIGSPIIITPNPVAVGGRITLNSSELFSQSNVSFTLVNTIGQTWSLSPENGELLIPSQLSNGLYYLIVTQSSGRELLPLILVE